MKPKRVLAAALTGSLLLALAACTVNVQPTQDSHTTPPQPAYSPPPVAPRPHVSGDADLFYDDLAPHGEWFTLDPHGWVWAPSGVPADWRPYTDGRWVYSDYGWTWVSDWEWGWAPFHYGRWLFESRYGWVWVPGREWAPAWVAWRHGGGWVGWAPLPPGVGWQVGVSVEESIRPFCWCFVEDRGFVDANLRVNILLPARNVTFLHLTRNVTHYTVVMNRIVNRSIDVDEIERATRRPIPRLRVVDTDNARLSPGDRIRGDEVRFFRLREGSQRKVSRPQPGPAPAPRAGVSPPSPARDLRQQHETERRRLEEQQGVKKSNLEEQHRKELAKPPAGTSKEELNKRHEAERRTLDEQHQRERQLLQQRQQREQKGETPRKQE